MTKSQLIDTIKSLPEEFSMEDIIERFIVMEKIEKGLKDSKSGKVTKDEEVEKKLSKWLD